jgi:hypothetical protein
MPDSKPRQGEAGAIKRGCDCIARVNAKLAAFNGVLETNLLANPPRVVISLCKRETHNRQKPPIMEASFCPFCGNAYPKDARELASHKATGAAS